MKIITASPDGSVVAANHATDGALRNWDRRHDEHDAAFRQRVIGEAPDADVLIFYTRPARVDVKPSRGVAGAA